MVNGINIYKTKWLENTATIESGCRMKEIKKKRNNIIENNISKLALSMIREVSKIPY